MLWNWWPDSDAVSYMKQLMNDINLKSDTTQMYITVRYLDKGREVNLNRVTVAGK